MFHNFHYAYLIGNILFLIIWLCLFIARKDLRKEMIIMSFLVAPLAFTQLFYFRDYWRPSYTLGTIFGVVGLEDILFMFFIGGITTVIYEEIFGIKYSKRHVKNHTYWMLAFAVLGILWMFIGNIVLGLNSMYVSISILLLTGMLILIFRHDLLRHAFYSGLIMGIFMFIFYAGFFNIAFHGIIEKWWILKNISGILILGVPIEELMWAFSWGFVAGPAYEFITGLKFKKE